MTGRPVKRTLRDSRPMPRSPVLGHRRRELAQESAEWASTQPQGARGEQVRRTTVGRGTRTGLAAGREGGPAPNYGRRRIGQGGHLEPGNFVTVRNRPRKPTVDGGPPLRVQPCTNTGASSGSAPATGFSSSVPNGSAIVAGAPRMADSPSKTSDSGLLRSGETTGSPRQQPS